jgi:oxygen-dependent protoporphyrinogen oxidase
MPALDADVLVVGAGIAGLTAAYRLRQRGLRVRVLEREPRVGGRISSEVRDNRVFERGAQLLSSRYRLIMPLIRELGLTKALRPVTPVHALARGGEIRKVSAADPGLTLRSQVLSARGWRRLVAGALRTPSLWWARLHDYSAWSAWDDRDAESFCAGRFGDEATRHLLEPSLESFYFHGLAQTSRALALAQLAYLVRPGTLYTLEAGLQALPEALSRELDVELGSEVREVRAHEFAASVATDRRSYAAKWVVLATTASVARRLYAARSEPEAYVLAAGYSSTLNLGVWFDQPRANATRDFYGLSLSRSERRVLSGIGVESCKDFGQELESYNLMAASSAVPELSSLTDAQVKSTLLGEGRRWLPRLHEAPVHSELVRWPEAAPLSPVGRATGILRYRRAWRPEQRVVLAGDYLGMPFIDGAAETADWAAERIIRATAKRAQAED